MSQETRKIFDELEEIMSSRENNSDGPSPMFENIGNALGGFLGIKIDKVLAAISIAIFKLVRYNKTRELDHLKDSINYLILALVMAMEEQ